MDTPTPATARQQHLMRGEFAPVFWEPLGKRGERLVAGLVLTNPHGIGKAYVTLHHKRLLDFVNPGKSESAAGVLKFAFDHFNKTLEAGGVIEDLRMPFASMTLGRTEAVTARTEEELMARASKLCTLLGHMPDAVNKPADAAQATAKTVQFIRDVRKHVGSIDKKLARDCMKRDQFYPVGASKMRVHFQSDGRFAQFCSLPLPNARPELATECQARLMDLSIIRQLNPSAQVALCINDQTTEAAAGFQGKRNATLEVRQKTIDMANAMRIPIHEYRHPEQAAHYLLEFAQG